MKFIRVLKAGIYDNIIDDIISNFKKITGISIYKLRQNPSEQEDFIYNPITQEREIGRSEFNQQTIDDVFPKIKKYVEDKYKIDISKDESFLYDLDEQISLVFDNGII